MQGLLTYSENSLSQLKITPVGAPGWLSWLRVCLLILAQILISTLCKPHVGPHTDTGHGDNLKNKNKNKQANKNSLCKINRDLQVSVLIQAHRAGEGLPAAGS